jgi:hypothetical protein
MLLESIRLDQGFDSQIHPSRELERAQSNQVPEAITSIR